MPRSAPDPAALETALLSSRLLPPVDRWAPPLLGEMDLRIARDGTWYHQGQPIQRETLVRLFASILGCASWRSEVPVETPIGQVSTAEPNPDAVDIETVLVRFTAEQLGQLEDA